MALSATSEPGYPKYLTSLSGEHRLVRSSAEAQALGDGWYDGRAAAAEAAASQPTVQVETPKRRGRPPKARP